MNSLIKKNKKHVAFISKNSHLIYAGIGWLIYLLLFFGLKHSIEPQHYIHSVLDNYIPFEKWFFLPYCFWYLYMGLTLIYFSRESIPDFMKLQLYIFIGFGICLITYIVYPNAIAFRPSIVKSDLITSVMADMYSIDSSTMVTPSMHVFASIAVHISLIKSRKTKKHKSLIFASFIIMILICASTVFVKQHSVIDIFWGIVLAISLYFPIYQTNIVYMLTKPLRKITKKYTLIDIQNKKE